MSLRSLLIKASSYNVTSAPLLSYSPTYRTEMKRIKFIWLSPLRNLLFSLAQHSADRQKNKGNKALRGGRGRGIRGLCLAWVLSCGAVPFPELFVLSFVFSNRLRIPGIAAHELGFGLGFRCLF